MKRKREDERKGENLEANRNRGKYSPQYVRAKLYRRIPQTAWNEEVRLNKDYYDKQMRE